MRKEMDEIYYNSGWAFPAAVAYLLDIGFQRAKQLTDEEIIEVTSANENQLMTVEFSRQIMRIAREIAKLYDNDPVQLIIYCQSKGLFADNLDS